MKELMFFARVSALALLMGCVILLFSLGSENSGGTAGVITLQPGSTANTGAGSLDGERSYPDGTEDILDLDVPLGWEMAFAAETSATDIEVLGSVNWLTLTFIITGVAAATSVVGLIWIRKSKVKDKQLGIGS